MIGGCAVIVCHADFTATVDEVSTAPGWTDRLDVHGVSSGDRVTIVYTEIATGRKITFLDEPGRLWIKQ